MPAPTELGRTVAVIGAGVSGLTAAHAAAHRDLRVTVLESAPTPGGCLSGTTLGGRVPGGADDGAEAALARRPEAAGLLAELGLPAVHPSRAHGSRLVTDRGPAPIPAGTLMGVPADPEALRGVLSDAGVDRMRAETLTPPVDGDVSCGEFLAARLGDELVDRVVDPLVGGVYAGHCRQLSLSATIPALVPAAQQGTSVRDAVAEVLAARARTSGADIPGAGAPESAQADRDEAPPVFLSLDGGIHGLIPALTEELTALGGTVETGAPVRGVRPGGRVLTDAGERIFDHVILAVPAWAATTLLDGAPEQAELAELLGRIDYATSAVVTAVLEDEAEADGGPLEGSGFLVPSALGGLVKAATHSSNKWPWLKTALPAGQHVVRMSVGRAGDEAWRTLDDAELSARALTEWRELTGFTGALLHSEVRRWERALPQYAPGHSALVARIEEAAARVPRLSLTGSYLDGVGIPACIGRARAAVAALTS